MIVNYYGGCSPTSRNFESRYPHHAYAALGYVVYVIEPSGATGFGQEFSARHVNTFGDGVADDIIEGTRKFAAEHPFVNDSKIGCIGASYGGFMTQYLQTKTDILPPPFRMPVSVTIPVIGEKAIGDIHTVRFRVPTVIPGKTRNSL